MTTISNEAITLPERMKSYEALPLEHKDGDYLLPCDGRPLVARLDGHSFSQFTRGFEKPHDVRLSYAMVETAKDVLNKYNAFTAYTQSDEITLIFIPAYVCIAEGVCDWREWPHNGRLLKLCSLMASLATARFNYHLEKSVAIFGNGQLKQPVVERILRHEAHFDARIFPVPNAMEAYNNVLWRLSYDCSRNSVHGLAREHFSYKQLHGKNGDEMKQMLIDEKSVNYEDMPDAFKYGTFVKKRIYNIMAIDQKSGKINHALRKELFSFSTKTFTAEMIVAKYWPPKNSEEKNSDDEQEESDQNKTEESDHKKQTESEKDDKQSEKDNMNDLFKKSLMHIL